MHLEWDYKKGTCDVSMPGYIEKALKVFQHEKPKKPQDQPYPAETPHYGAKVQYTKEDHSAPMTQTETTRLQRVVGKFLYYARAVDNTMLKALGSLASAQTKGTEQTAKALAQLLDYGASHPDAKIRFHKSNMILWVNSDASYLNEPGSKSTVGGYHYLSSHPPDPNKAPQQNDPPPPLNAPVQVV